MSFLCKGRFGTQEVSWLYINNAWLPVIAVCNQRLFRDAPPIAEIPAVENYQFTVEGKMTTQTWTPNSTYYIYAEVQINDGTWESIGANNPSVSSDFFNFSQLSPGDTIGFRLRFGNQAGTSFGPYTGEFGTIGNTKIFQVTNAPAFENSDIFASGATPVDGENINFFVEQDYITIDHPENLYRLDVSDMGLVGNFDLTRCSQLNRLYCNYNYDGDGSGILSIDVSGLTELRRLRAYGMQMLTSVNVSGCTSLDQLRLDETGITSLDISGTSMGYMTLNNCESLETIIATGVTGSDGKAYYTMQDCNLSAEAINAFFTSLGTQGGWKGLLVIGQNPGASICNPTIATTKGWTVSGGPNRIFNGAAPINLADFQYTGEVSLMHYGNDVFIEDPDSLLTFTCSGSAAGSLRLYGCDNLTAIDISSNNGITELYCPYNYNLASLAVSNCTSLRDLDCQESSITSLSLLGCSSLVYLVANNTNSLSSLSNIPTSIQEVYIQNQQQDGGLSFYGCNSLIRIEADGCTSDNIDLTGCGNLISANFNNCTALNTLSMSDSGESLQHFYMQRTAMTSITLDSFVSLIDVDLSNNTSLTSIEIGSCPLLQQVNSSSCASLTGLDLANNSGLMQIYGSDSPNLTFVTVANCSSLQYLAFTNCGLNEASINNLFGQLPIYMGHIYVSDNPGAGTCDTTIATDKTWAVN
jgi:hypothetical protein